MLGPRGVVHNEQGSKRLLSRYRILDLTDDRGHFCGMILAQLGAEVIAIEPPEGQRRDVNDRMRTTLSTQRNH